MDWAEYFARRPVGWREDHRTCYMLSAQGVKAKPHELFSSLYVMEKEKQELAEESVEQDAAKLVGSSLFSKMLKDTQWDIDTGV